jgi:hypothetical protein
MTEPIQARDAQTRLAHQGAWKHLNRAVPTRRESIQPLRIIIDPTGSTDQKRDENAVLLMKMLYLAPDIPGYEILVAPEFICQDSLVKVS